MPRARELAYYARHSRLTTPGARASLFAETPHDYAGLVALVRNVVADEAKPAADPAAERDAGVRFVEAMLERIATRDCRPLGAPRAPADRLRGTSRDAATLTVALLRHQARPARLRGGFASYRGPGGRVAADRWLCETWDRDARRWRLIDAALPGRADAPDPLDVPRGAFLGAGDAWRAIRSGQEAPERFGAPALGLSGEWYVAASVVRDLAALNKREMAPFDYWGLALDICLERSVSPPQRQVVDWIAEITAGAAADFERVRAGYATHPRLRVADPIKSFPRNVETDVSLGLP